VQGASAPAPVVSAIHAKIVRRAAAQWGDYDAAVLAAVQHRLAAGDTTTVAEDASVGVREMADSPEGAHPSGSAVQDR